MSKAKSVPITKWVDCDIVVQSGHENHLSGWAEGGSGPMGQESDWTRAIANEAVGILKAAGVRAVKNDASIPAGGVGWNCILAVAIHFDDPLDGDKDDEGTKSEAGPSIAYPVGVGNEPAAAEFKALYQQVWPWPKLWKNDNYTEDEAKYYGFRYWHTTDAEMLIEFGDIGSKRQGEWFKPRLKWLGALLAHFLSKRSGKGNVPMPAPFAANGTTAISGDGTGKHPAAAGLVKPVIEPDADDSLFNLSSVALRGDETLEAIADGHAELTTGPHRLDSTKRVQLTLNRLAGTRPSYYIDYGPGTKNLGFFGPHTRTALCAFQRDTGLPVSGVLEQATVRALDAGMKKLEDQPPVIDGTPGIPATIIQLAATSEVAHYDWPGRGVAPLGYTKGMALVYARAYCRYKQGVPVYVEMAKPLVAQTKQDALYRFQKEFSDAGLPLPDQAGVEMLRRTFVFLLGLGMRESSGQWNDGLYKPDGNTHHDTAEAGVMQMSYNIIGSNALAKGLYASYRGKADPWFPVFKEGVKNNPKGLENWGEGAGVEFQQLAKYNPTFSAELAALRLRSLCWHWGPVREREMKITTKADDLFRKVQDAVDAHGLCAQLG